MKLRFVTVLPALVAVFAGPCAALALDLQEYSELTGFIRRMAEEHGFSTKDLHRVFARVHYREDIIEAIERPKEALPWYEYRNLFVTDQHAQRGKIYWTEHATALSRARELYGVAPEIVVAVLGIETQYGRNKGEYPVVDALTTLMLGYPPRAEFFRRELEEYLLLARELDADPLTIKGSYAGAMGLPQFIPSSYRRYAVDFDGDHRRDLLTSAEDAIGSVANFLNAHGWEANQPVSEDVDLEGSLYVWVEKLGVKPILSVRHLGTYGVFPRNPEGEDRSAALIVLDGERGPIYRLGYNNFYVITRYNRSTRYAMAVYELGQMIRRLHKGES